MRMVWLVAGALVAALNACDAERNATGEGPLGAAGAEGSGPEPGLELSCRRYCGIFTWAAPKCEPGTEAIHGELVEGEAIPTTVVPLSDDRACMDSCTAFTGGHDCWQKDAAYNNCLASARWQCGEDQMWGTNDCTDFGDDDWLCTE